MASDFLDPKMYKIVKSDKHSTTLKHKRGHELRIAHNVISPKMRASLQALSKIGQEDATDSQAQESQDQKQYGKVLMKAEGGDLEQKTVFGQPVYGTGVSKPKAPDHEGTPPGSNDEPWPLPSQTSVGKAIQAKKDAQAQPEAKGGEVRKTLSESDKHHSYKKGKEYFITDKSSNRTRRHQDIASLRSDEAHMQEHGVLPDRKEGWYAAGGEVRMAKGGNVETPAAPGSTPNGAYDAGLPCLNPNCKSHGRPHPNCRCYAGMADGGEVSKLRYCAHGQPHQEGCEYAHGGKVHSRDVSRDHLDSGNTPGRSTQGSITKDAHYANKAGMPEVASRMQNEAKAEAKGRINMERTVKPNIKGMADGGTAVPYGMSASDIPRDESTTERELDQYEAQNPSRLEQSNNDRIAAKAPNSPMLRPGMPGYDEKPTTINDTEDPPEDGSETNQAMYQKIHSGDPYGRSPAQQPQPQEAQQDPNEVPQAQDTVAMDQTQPQAELQPVDHAADIINENKAFQQDLMNGHITPKTYSDLMYHNKDGSEKSTLGKIGSIFGLILSSAGAGLAHQPVMAMHMMDNVIKNDLEAQMKSKENAQNFFRINQARMLNDANIKSIMASADKTDAEKDATLQAIQIKAAAQTYADMGSVAVKKIHDQVNKMPEGPEKQKAAQLGLMVAQAAETNGAKAAMMAAAGMNNLSMYGINPDQSDSNQDPEIKFQNDMQARENAGDKAGADSIRERHIPGVPGLATAPVSEDMRNKFRDMNILDNKVKDVLSFAQQYKGSIDPSIRAQARQKAEELTSFYNKSVDSLGLSKGRLGWLEEQIKKNPTSFIEQLLGNNATLREIRDSNMQRVNQLKHDLGFPVPKPKEQEQMSKSGKPIVFRNGRWEYK